MVTSGQLALSLSQVERTTVGLSITCYEDVVWLLMWVRWTFPRLRIDQILKLEWKYLMPLSLIILIMMTVCVAFGFHG